MPDRSSAWWGSAFPIPQQTAPLPPPEYCPLSPSSYVTTPVVHFLNNYYYFYLLKIIAIDLIDYNENLC